MAIFNPDRYGFCVVGDKVIVMDADRRSMQTQVWMEDVLRLSELDIDYATRGYFMPGRIQFFTGADYNTSLEVTEDIVADAVAAYARLYNVTIPSAILVPVYNGVWPGAQGDTWPPVMKWNFDTARWETAQ